MFPSKPLKLTYSYANRKFHLPQKQSAGFLIPLSLFILVGLGVLAIAISRMSSQANTSFTLEGVSAQAFYAAETGAQYGMHRLMFDVDDRTTSDANCAAMPANVDNFPRASAAGLQACAISLSCDRATVSGSPKSFYTIRSSATCGSGNLSSTRTIEVSAFM